LIDAKGTDLLKIRAFLLKKTREWFENNCYIETQGPILLPSESKSSTAFEVKYFNKKAYLTKGFLPYGKLFVDKLGKVYTIMPSFRKELPSKRHLTEYWRIESVAHCNIADCMSIQEDLVSFLCNSIAIEFKETLERFGRPCADLMKVKKPFSRITYDQAIDVLQNAGCQIVWGQEIGWELERRLSFHFDKPFLILNYPCNSATFLHKADIDRPELSLSADLIAPEGFGEIASSLQMITEEELLNRKIEEARLSIKEKNWFLTFMGSYGKPCSGFAIGVERLIQWMCNLKDIKEVVPFPRLPQINYP
jgi:asparaginyl-tRNA synthetase